MKRILHCAGVTVLLLAASGAAAETNRVPATKVYRGSVLVPCTNSGQSTPQSTAFALPSLEAAVKFILDNTASHADCRHQVIWHYDLVRTSPTGPRSVEVIGRSQYDGSEQLIAAILVQHDCPPVRNVGSDTCPALAAPNAGQAPTVKSMRPAEAKAVAPRLPQTVAPRLQ